MTTYGSSMTSQSKKTKGRKMNDEDEESVDQFQSKENFPRVQYEFQLDVDIRKTGGKPIIQGYGKSLYEVEWIDREGPPIVLLQIDGAKPIKDASYYVQLSCHPHIIRTYGLVQCHPGSTMLLQECPPQGNLSELLRGNEFTPNERVLWEIFEQICDAMIFLLEKNIIHGDLACRNVLVFQMNPINPKKNFVKLTDFGLTSVSTLYSIVDSPNLTTMTIIPTRYVAPEFLRNLRRLDYSEKSDIYSMGVLMWEACALGKLPYANVDDSETIRQYKLKDKKLSKPSLCSDNLWTIINDCWEIEPKHRPRFQSLKKLLLNLHSESIEKSKTKIIPIITTDPTVIPLPLNKTDYSRYEDCREQDNNIDTSDSKRERYYSGEESVDSNEKSHVRDGSTSCPFCQECLASEMDLRDHLILCGTKTDQCPNCRRFIQRAVFAYHYENNCADINETDATSKRTNNSSEIVECEVCKNYFVRNEYQLHKNNCIRNPANTNNTFQQRSDQSNLIPCEYCQAQYSAKQFVEHQNSCSKNPNRTNTNRSLVLANNGSDSPIIDPQQRLLEGNEDEVHCCTCS